MTNGEQSSHAATSPTNGEAVRCDEWVAELETACRTLALAEQQCWREGMQIEHGSLVRGHLALCWLLHLERRRFATERLSNGGPT